MKSYLAWNRSEQVCPAIASSPPPSAFAAIPSFSLNGITSCPSSTTSSSFLHPPSSSDSTNLLSNLVAASAPTDSSTTINSINIFLDPTTPKNSQLLGPPDITTLTPHSPQVTTSAINHPQPHLSAAAAEYLLAAALATNTSQLACPSTSYPQPITPIQHPPTPQQQLDSLISQYNQEQNLQRQQSAAAWVAAFQQRQQQQQQDFHQTSLDTPAAGPPSINSAGSGNVDLFATATQTSTIENNATAAASIVAQLAAAAAAQNGRGNLHSDGPLANNLANVCAAAAAVAASSVTVNGVATTTTTSSTIQQPLSIDNNVGPSSGLSTTSTSIVQPNNSRIEKVSSTPILLNTLPPAAFESANNLASAVTAASSFFSPQHSSAFQLVSPLSQPPQPSPAAKLNEINNLFQQHHQQLQSQNLSSLNNPQEAIHSATAVAQQQQALTLASTLSVSALPLPPSVGAPSSSLTLSSTSSSQSQLRQPTGQQQAVPAGPSQQQQSHRHQTNNNEIHPTSMNQAAAAAAAALYPQLMCLPALLDHLGPHILRSHMNSTQLKPIPNNEKVDLARFRNKEPQEWVMDDVLAWILDVARRNQVPVENINMHKFAQYNGPKLLLMNEQAFLDRDPVYGSMLFTEFRKLTSDDNVLDDWMRSYKDAEEDSRPSTSRGLPFDIKPPSSQSSSSSQNHFNGFLGVNSPISPLIQNSLSQHAAAAVAQQFLKPPQGATLTTLHRAAVAAAGPPQLSAARLVAAAQNSLSNGNTTYDSRGDQSFHGVNNLRIKKNKDGRPRKRSQHTKGNKLWEFIRDALKDPSTCPSIVRWEDPVEGVFRIVESEKLARLWGEKKNNQKMTYEKLSRAMRTYYEKQILVPVPKTGLYPKKLVYKFGPGAHGWCAPPNMIAASNAAMRLDPIDMDTA